MAIPSSIHLDPNEKDCLAPIDVSFEIANRGSDPVGINAVRVGCGCVQANEAAPLILGGSVESIRLTVFPRKWGAGHQRKLVQIEIGDGELFSVELEGEFIRSQASNVVAGGGTKCVRIPIQLNTTTFTEQIDIPVDEALVGSYRALVDSTWCSAEYEAAKHVVHVTVNLEEQVLRRVRFSEDLSATVELVGPLLAGTWHIDVRQNLDSIRFGSKLVSAIDKTITFQIVAPSLRASGWIPQVVSVKGLTCQMQQEVKMVDHSGGYVLTARIDESPTRPVPGFIQFDHATYRSIRIPVVVMP